jgi:multidrug transporter EmrE-like cation transporter
MTDFMKIGLMIVLTIGSNTIAQLLLKQSSQIGTLLNIFFMGGVGFYGLSTIFYMTVLKQVSLSIAYPTIIGATIVLTTTLNSLIYREKLFSSQVAGIVLIMCGIYSISASSKHV